MLIANYKNENITTVEGNVARLNICVFDEEGEMCELGGDIFVLGRDKDTNFIEICTYSWVLKVAPQDGLGKKFALPISFTNVWGNILKNVIKNQCKLEYDFTIKLKAKINTRLIHLEPVLAKYFNQRAEINLRTDRQEWVTKFLV